MTIFITGIFEPPVSSFEVAGLPNSSARFTNQPLSFITLVHTVEEEIEKTQIQRWTWDDEDDIMKPGKKKKSTRESSEVTVLDHCIL